MTNLRDTFSVGDRLGRFEILGPLGSGAMGDVYRARDSHLGRDVAIKILPSVFADNVDRCRRFEREARAAGRLNHPNILAVYDVGVDEGTPFIVTELLEGETLKQRMNGRPLPPRKAVDYALQIAGGLAAGHDAGIVHCDIKPDNLFVSRDGRVKILDFGVAQMAGTDTGGDPSATIVLDDAPIARVAGTASYMSPEQARGRRTDHRSDLFSLGVVLYEMLAGFSPFRRSTPAATLGAIIHEDVPDLTHPRGVSRALDRIVRHCLEKAPEERFQNARDLIFDLEALPDDSGTAPARSRWGLSSARTIRGLVLFSVLAAATLGYVAGLRRNGTRDLRKPAVPSLQRLTDFPGIEESASLSPDGRHVAFTASVRGRRQIFVRLLAGGSPVQVTSDTADHQSPRWSPDGNMILYYSPASSEAVQGAIWSIQALGGSPRRVIDSIGDADVSRNGRLSCFRLQSGRIQLVDAALDGSDVRVIAEARSGYHLRPRWSPDGRWIAFQEGDGVRFDIFVIPGTGGTPRKLTAERDMIRGHAWLPDSSGLVYASSRGSTVPYLSPMALWELNLDGTSHQITPLDGWYEQPDVDSSGRVAATRMRIELDLWKIPFGDNALENVRRAERLTRQTGRVMTPSVSPDGEHVVFLSDSGGHANLWTQSLRDGSLRQVTFEQAPDVSVGAPVWSPDGRAIAFVSSKGRTGFEFGVWLVNPDGANLRNAAPRGLGMAWSADGQWIYYAESSAGALYKVRASGGAPVKVRSEPTRNVIGLHDTTLYYVVERPLLDGRPELEIRAANPEGGPSRAIARVPASRVPSWQIVNPALSPDGDWLAMPLTDGYVTNLWALSTRTGSWRQVTDFQDRATFIARRVSWSADGQALVAAIGEGDADIMLLTGLVRR